jgi:hypothetical protein
MQGATASVCQKCGFQASGPGAEICPKCGVVHAKVQRAMAEQVAARKKFAAERNLSETIANSMEEDENLRLTMNFELDPEISRDEEAYPVTHFLSGFFAFLAVFTALVEVMGLWHFYSWGKALLSTQELLLSMISLSLLAATSVVILLAISEWLKMGRDVANNTRAMRAYLRRIAGK